MRVLATGVVDGPEARGIVRVVEPDYVHYGFPRRSSEEDLDVVRRLRSRTVAAINHHHGLGASVQKALRYNGGPRGAGGD